MDKLQVTQVQIKKSCRNLHGSNKAFDLAVQYLTKAYSDTVKADINKDATFIIKLELER